MMKYVWIALIALVIAALVVFATNRVGFVKGLIGPKG